MGFGVVTCSSGIWTVSLGWSGVFSIISLFVSSHASKFCIHIGAKDEKAYRNIEQKEKPTFLHQSLWLLAMLINISHKSATFCRWNRSRSACIVELEILKCCVAGCRASSSYLGWNELDEPTWGLKNVPERYFLVFWLSHCGRQFRVLRPSCRVKYSQCRSIPGGFVRHRAGSGPEWGGNEFVVSNSGAPSKSSWLGITREESVRSPYLFQVLPPNDELLVHSSRGLPVVLTCFQVHPESSYIEHVFDDDRQVIFGSSQDRIG